MVIFAVIFIFIFITLLYRIEDNRRELQLQKDTIIREGTVKFTPEDLENFYPEYYSVIRPSNDRLVIYQKSRYERNPCTDTLIGTDKCEDVVVNDVGYNLIKCGASSKQDPKNPTTCIYDLGTNPPVIQQDYNLCEILNDPVTKDLVYYYSKNC